MYQLKFKKVKLTLTFSFIEILLFLNFQPDGKTLEERMANSSINSSKQENTVEKNSSFNSSKPENIIQRNSSFDNWEDLSLL